jgi:hypothetical protein
VYACELKFEDTRLETFRQRFGEFMDSMNMPWSLNKNFWTERRVRATATSPDSVSITITDRNFEEGGNNGSYVFIQAKHYQTNTLRVSLYWRNAGDQMINVFAYFAANFYDVDIRPILEAQSGEDTQASEGDKLHAEVSEFIQNMGKPVSPTTVQKYHHLAKTTTLSARKIQTRLSTDTDSYYKHCYRDTKEPPIDMDDRAKRIKQKRWPPL